MTHIRRSVPHFLLDLVRAVLFQVLVMTSSVNMNEAYSNIFHARNAISVGEFCKAEKLLHKAQRLYSTEVATELLLSISDGLQAEIVRDVLNYRNYYKLFGLSKEASIEDIKEAYRNLALRLHPDKNSAAGATEACQIINRAYEVLTDEEQRREYDAREVPDQDTARSRPSQTQSMEQPDFADLLTGVAVLAGAVFGGILVAKALEFVKKVWRGNTSAIVSSESSNNSTRQF